MNPPNDEPRILLAHGGGGELTGQLIEQHILPALSNEWLDPLTDAACLGELTGEVVMTTDAFVVQPLEFPGGDIGRLAVCGTVNDVAMAGARPVAIALAMVLEEGLAMATLDAVLASIAQTARQAGVRVATGDTKVVERRGGDGMTITTTGVGVRTGPALSMARIRPGDAVLINGGIAEHGLAVMSVREGLAFRTELVSDVAPLAGLVGRLLDSGAEVKFLRDPTRGGLAGVLNDVADRAGLSVQVREDAIPLSGAARRTADLLGLDPLTVANEGKVVAIVPGADADKALAALRADPLGAEAAIIGEVTDARPALAELVTRAGGKRVISRPYGEDLPRIC